MALTDTAMDALTAARSAASEPIDDEAAAEEEAADKRARLAGEPPLPPLPPVLRGR
jgi:hypothetical protein